METKGAPAGSTRRHPEVDWIKAVSAATVVMIHSFPPFPPRSSTVLWQFGEIMLFAVPGFLFASGFLYARAGSRDWLPTMGRRLRRLLVPYLGFSLLAQVYPLPLEVNSELSLVEQLFYGAALGPYYYVFVIFWLTLATPLVARIPRSVFPAVVVAALILQWGFQTAVLVSFSPLWWLRNPLHWAATFLLGWWFFEHRQTIGSVLQQNRAYWLVSLLGAWLAAQFYLAGAQNGWVMHTVSWLQSYATLGVILVATIGRSEAPRLVRWLSEASYSIYLSHLFFVGPVLRWLPQGGGWLVGTRIVAAWAAGMAGGSALLAAGRKFVGRERTRAWLG